MRVSFTSLGNDIPNNTIVVNNPHFMTVNYEVHWSLCALLIVLYLFNTYYNCLKYLLIF